jgi:hypothetical protein
LSSNRHPHSVSLALVCVLLSGCSTSPPAYPDAKYSLRYSFRPGEERCFETRHRAMGSEDEREVLLYQSDLKARLRVVASTPEESRLRLSVAGLNWEANHIGHCVWNSDDEPMPDLIGPTFEFVASAMGETPPIPAADLEPRMNRAWRLSHIPQHLFAKLPEKLVAVGDSWEITHTASPSSSGPVVTRQILYRLAAVEDGVAQIEIGYPVEGAPGIEIDQSVSKGHLAFDIGRGRIVSLSHRMVVQSEVIGSKGSMDVSSELRAVEPWPEPGEEEIMRLIDRLRAEDRQERIRAVAGLNRLGRRAVPAIPAMVEVLSIPRDDPNTVGFDRFVDPILEILGYLQPESVPHLARLARGHDELSRERALRAMTHVADLDPKPLLGLLADSDASVRAACCEAIGSVYRSRAMWTRHAEAIVTGLIEAIQDDNVAVRVEVVETLAKAMEFDSRTKGALEAAAEDGEPAVREAASRALKPANR